VHGPPPPGPSLAAFALPAAPTAAFWPNADPPNVAPPPNGLFVGAAPPPPNVVPPPKGDGDAPPPKGDGDAAAGWPNGLKAAGCAPPNGLAAAAAG